MGGVDSGTFRAEHSVAALASLAKRGFWDRGQLQPDHMVAAAGGERTHAIWMHVFEVHPGEEDDSTVP